MISIQNIATRKITADEVNDFVPNIRSNLQYDLCLGAFLDDELIGVITARRFEKGRYAVDNFHVLPLFRSMGIGKKLVEAMKQLLLEFSADTLRFRFNSKEYSIDSFSSFLRKLSHIEPYQISSLYRMTLKEIYEVFIKRYFRENESPLDGYDIVFLSDLNEIQVKSYNELIESSVPMSLRPFENPQSTLNECSFLVLNGERRMIAWTILEKIRHNEVGVLATYVVPSYRTTLLGLALWKYLYSRAAEIGLLKEIQWLSFYFDINDSRNIDLYRLLFGRAEQVDYYCADYTI